MRSPPEETCHDWVMANERTAAALKAKEQTLANTLVWMWRGYRAE
jgi:iron(III)-enterobactin esterase